MKKRKLILGFFLITTLGIFLGINQISNAKSAGSPDSNTGSPGDGQTCAHVGCHTGTASFKPNVLTTDVPPYGYLAGNTYTINCTITESGKVKFGFQASAQNTTGAALGTLIVTNATTTKLTGFEKYITHTVSGTSGSGTKTWSFNWTPGTSHGDVTFYAALNASNNDAHASGDAIYYTSITILEDPSNATAIANLELNGNLIFNNPVYDNLQIQLKNNLEPVSVSMYNLKGELVYSEIIQTELLDISTSNFAKGTYLLNIANSTSSITRKLIHL